jgi:hypothetical protein
MAKSITDFEGSNPMVLYNETSPMTDNASFFL